MTYENTWSNQSILSQLAKYTVNFSENFHYALNKEKPYKECYRMYLQVGEAGREKGRRSVTIYFPCLCTLKILHNLNGLHLFYGLYVLKVLRTFTVLLVLNILRPQFSSYRSCLPHLFLCSISFISLLFSQLADLYFVLFFASFMSSQQNCSIFLKTYAVAVARTVV